MGGDGLMGCFSFSYGKLKKKMFFGKSVIFSPKNVFYLHYS